MPLRTRDPLGTGRGSMVWFTQASMMMSAQLPTDTMAEAKRQLKEFKKSHPDQPPPFSISVDVEGRLKDGVFPINSGPFSKPN